MNTGIQEEISLVPDGVLLKFDTRKCFPVQSASQTSKLVGFSGSLYSLDWTGLDFDLIISPLFLS